MKLFSIAIVSALAATCTPPAPPSRMDASAGSCDTACSTLNFLGCPEGRASNCVAACEHAPVLHVDMHLSCLAAATSKAEARLCKSVDCP
jgi:hypothetical protein